MKSMRGKFSEVLAVGDRELTHVPKAPAHGNFVDRDVWSRALEFTPCAVQANRLQIDLDQRSVGASQEPLFQFEIDDSDAEMLLHGMDPIALTLRLEDQIRDFQQSDEQKRPWVYL